MKWCIFDAGTGEIVMNGQAGAGQSLAEVGYELGTPMVNIPGYVDLTTHYYWSGEFHEFGASPGEFYVWDWSTHAWALPATALIDARAKQSSLLNSACQEAIYSGFDSSALGVAFHYPAKAQDQVNLIASVTASLLPGLPSGWETPVWVQAAEEWSNQPHTAAEIQQVFLDANASIVSTLEINVGLQEQITAAESIAEIQAVVWTN